MNETAEIESTLLKVYNNVNLRKHCLPMIPEMWLDYYFPEYFDLPEDYQEILTWVYNGWNLLWLGYRWCAKTAVIRKMISMFVAIKKKRFVRWTSYDADKSVENVTSLSNMLIGYPWSRFVRDYGHLYWREQKKTKWKTKEEKRMSWFYTTNGAIIKANSLRKSTRWLNIYIWGSTSRPDLDVLDDIDDDENTMSPRIITKNYNKVKGAIFGGNTSQKIVLWNVIQEDWVLPRLVEDYKDNDDWLIVNTKLYEWDKLHRPARFVWTKQEARNINRLVDRDDKKVVSVEWLREDQGRDRFGANFLLEALRNDVPIIEEHRLKKETYTGIPALDGVWMSIDFAESEEDWSDPIGITIWTKKYKTKKRNIKHSENLKWRQKDLKNVWERIKFLIDKFGVNKPIIIENKAGWISLKKYLTYEYSLSCILYNPGKKTKGIRLRLCQPFIESWAITFDPDIDPEFLKEIYKFPNIKHDDRVDSFTALIDKSKMWDVDDLLQAWTSKNSLEKPLENDNKEVDIKRIIWKYSNRGSLGKFTNF